MNGVNLAFNSITHSIAEFFSSPVSRITSIGIRAFAQLGQCLYAGYLAANSFYRGYKCKQHDSLQLSDHYKLVKCQALLNQIDAIKKGTENTQVQLNGAMLLNECATLISIEASRSRLSGRPIRNPSGQIDFQEMTRFNPSLVEKVNHVLANVEAEQPIEDLAALVENGQWETVFPNGSNRLSEEKLEETMIHVYAALYKGLITLDELASGLLFGETTQDPSIEFEFEPLKINSITEKVPPNLRFQIRYKVDESKLTDETRPSYDFLQTEAKRHAKNYIPLFWDGKNFLAPSFSYMKTFFNEIKKKKETKDLINQEITPVAGLTPVDQLLSRLKQGKSDCAFILPSDKVKIHGVKPLGCLAAIHDFFHANLREFLISEIHLSFAESFLNHPYTQKFLSQFPLGFNLEGDVNGVIALMESLNAKSPTKEDEKIFAGFCLFLSACSFIDGIPNLSDWYYSNNMEKPFNTTLNETKLFEFAADGAARQLHHAAFEQVSIAKFYIEKYYPKRWIDFEANEKFQQNYSKLVSQLNTKLYKFNHGISQSLYEALLGLFERDNR